MFPVRRKRTASTLLRPAPPHTPYQRARRPRSSSARRLQPGLGPGPHVRWRARAREGGHLRCPGSGSRSRRLRSGPPVPGGAYPGVRRWMGRGPKALRPQSRPAKHRARTGPAACSRVLRKLVRHGAPAGPLTQSLVGCVVLRDDLGRNPAALAHLVAALFGPGPDFRAALPARPSPRAATPPATAATACLARVIDVGLKLFAELA